MNVSDRMIIALMTETQCPNASVLSTWIRHPLPARDSPYFRRTTYDGRKIEFLVDYDGLLKKGGPPIENLLTLNKVCCVFIPCHGKGCPRKSEWWSVPFPFRPRFGMRQNNSLNSSREAFPDCSENWSAQRQCLCRGRPKPTPSTPTEHAITKPKHRPQPAPHPVLHAGDRDQTRGC